MIFNGSATDFLLAPEKHAVFLFSTLDGTIAGMESDCWISPGSQSSLYQRCHRRSWRSGSGYTGITCRHH